MAGDARIRGRLVTRFVFEDGGEPEVESARSSVQIGRSARGAIQTTVKVYSGDSPDDVEEARLRAVAVFKAIEDELAQPE